MAEHDPKVEAALVSERLGQIDERLEDLERWAASSDARLARLVELEEKRDVREERALQIEAQRRQASAEAEARRLDAELAERREHRSWIRSTVGERVVSAVVLVLTAVASAVGGWGLRGGGQ